MVDRHGQVVRSHGQSRCRPGELLNVATPVETVDVWECATDVVVGVLARLNQSHNRPVPSRGGGSLTACVRTDGIIIVNISRVEGRSTSAAKIVDESARRPLVEDDTVITDIYHRVLMVVVRMGIFSIHVQRALLLELKRKLIPVVGDQLGSVGARDATKVEVSPPAPENGWNHCAAGHMEQTELTRVN